MGILSPEAAPGNEAGIAFHTSRSTRLRVRSGSAPRLVSKGLTTPEEKMFSQNYALQSEWGVYQARRSFSGYLVKAFFPAAEQACVLASKGLASPAA